MPKKSMSDAVQAYIDKDNKEKERIKEFQDKLREKIIEKLGILSLTPLSVENGNIVSFEWKGSIIKFKIWESNSGWKVCRVGACSKCKKTIFSYEEWEITLETIGALIITPHWKPHDNCEMGLIDRIQSYIDEIKNHMRNNDA